jgi:nucleotide-binding universal stress UspA family protein
MQGPPKTILLATDLSARCDRAFDRALALAAEWKARLVVVHVMEASPTDVITGTDPVPSWRRTQDPQKIAEARIRSELAEAAPGLTVVIEKGDAAEAIIRVAEARDGGLIVTGVARDETLGRLALGATVRQLLQRSAIPLMVVRKRGHRPHRHVVVATDFSDSSRHALEATVRFFPQTVVTLFNAYDAPLSGLASDPASYREQLRAAAVQEAEAFLKSADLSGWQGQKPEILVEQGDPERLVYEYVTERNVDLVALGTHGRSALFDILIGSVAQGLVDSLPCDALIIREPRAKVG